MYSSLWEHYLIFLNIQSCVILFGIIKNYAFLQCMISNFTEIHFNPVSFFAIEWCELIRTSKIRVKVSFKSC